MTSGNIAVFDHDVRRYADFLRRFAPRSSRSTASAGASSSTGGSRSSSTRKKPGEVDIPEVQDIKRLHPRGGGGGRHPDPRAWTREQARFLNLPFYQTGKVARTRSARTTSRIVRELLEELQPELVFVAGDLSDPHGTHRMCLEAIYRALGRVRAAGASGRRSGCTAARGRSGRSPRPTWLVPLSQEELRRKIQAIFKHQSQKDTAPFPGQDDREFWQRVEERNKGTAAELDRLGLAEYFAMEAYVVEG